MWKPIPNTNNSYEASSEGLIRSVDRLGADGRQLKGKPSKPWAINSGYLAVALRIDGKTKRFLVHRLVASAFLGVNDDLDVNHIDGNKLNNASRNLEYVTKSENTRHAINLGLMRVSEENAKAFGARMKNLLSKPVIQKDLNGNFIARYDSLTSVNLMHGYDKTAIGRCANGKQRTSYGFIWEWEDTEKCNDYPKGVGAW